MWIKMSIFFDVRLERGRSSSNNQVRNMKKRWNLDGVKRWRAHIRVFESDGAPKIDIFSQIGTKE